MHGDSGLGGPLYVAFIAAFVGTLALALFVAIDAVRPVRQARFAEIPEQSWLYAVPSALFLASAVFVQVVRIPVVAGITYLASPMFFALGVVYLLRVVFPRPVVQPPSDTSTD